MLLSSGVTVSASADHDTTPVALTNTRNALPTRRVVTRTLPSPQPNDKPRFDLVANGPQHHWALWQRIRGVRDSAELAEQMRPQLADEENRAGNDHQASGNSRHKNARVGQGGNWILDANDVAVDGPGPYNELGQPLRILGAIAL
jgi:hypothetical protein